MVPERVKNWTRASAESPWWAGWRLTVAMLALLIGGGTQGDLQGRARMLHDLGQNLRSVAAAAWDETQVAR